MGSRISNNYTQEEVSHELHDPCDRRVTWGVLIDLVFLTVAKNAYDPFVIKVTVWLFIDLVF